MGNGMILNLELVGGPYDGAVYQIYDDPPEIYHLQTVVTGKIVKYILAKQTPESVIYEYQGYESVFGQKK